MARVPVIDPKTATGVEVIATVVLNIFTNVIGKATRVEIDFPKIDLLNASLKAAA